MVYVESEMTARISVRKFIDDLVWTKSVSLERTSVPDLVQECLLAGYIPVELEVVDRDVRRRHLDLAFEHIGHDNYNWFGGTIWFNTEEDAVWFSLLASK